MTAPALVSSSESSSALAIPKSVTFTVPPGVTMMFPGLMSRWYTPASWATVSAAAVSAAISAARRGSSAPSVRRISRKVRPSINSITMK